MTQSETQKRLAHYQKMQEEAEREKRQEKRPHCWLCRLLRRKQ